jgi:hypothetical protein
MRAPRRPSRKRPMRTTNRSATRPNPSHPMLSTTATRASLPSDGASSTVALATRQDQQRDRERSALLPRTTGRSRTAARSGPLVPGGCRSDERVERAPAHARALPERDEIRRDSGPGGRGDASGRAGPARRAPPGAHCAEAGLVSAPTSGGEGLGGGSEPPVPWTRLSRASGGVGCELRQRRGEEALHRVQWRGALVCPAQDEGALERCEQYGGIVLCG